jgi:hypothetical protein
MLAQNSKVSSSINLEELSLGTGVHLFFKNYFFHGCLFLLMFVVYALFALITNVTHAPICTSYFSCGVAMIGGGSKMRPEFISNPSQTSLNLVQSAIGVIFVVVWGILYIIKNKKEADFVAEISSKRVSASDFTLMVTHVPRSFFLDDNPSDSGQALGEQPLGST